MQTKFLICADLHDGSIRPVLVSDTPGKIAGILTQSTGFYKKAEDGESRLYVELPLVPGEDEISITRKLSELEEFINAH